MSAVTPARRAAYEAVRRTFEDGAWTDRAFPVAAERHSLDRRERAQGQRLAYGAVQRRGSIDHVIERLAGRPPDRLDPPVLAALRIGLYELLYSRAADHATVDQAVELAKLGLAGGGAGRARAAAGLVNGVLRRAARERRRLFDGVDGSTPEGAAILLSYPRWLARMWWEELGPESARSLMAAMDERAETAVRVNTLRARPEPLAARLRDGGQAAASPPAPAPLSPPEALVLRGQLADVTRSAIDSGEAVVQSRGSQAVIEILDPRPGERILDLCAAPGVKASGIAARLANRGRVVSV